MVLGAVICNIMFWKLNKTPPVNLFTVVAILGFSVWIIYILDRLLDNNKIDLTPTERHIFHQQNAKVLWYFIGLLTLICAVLVIYLPKNIIIFGITILSITGIYLLIISKISSRNNFQHYKEPITAFVYMSGVFGTTVLSNLHLFSLRIGFVFLLIVFQNLLLFSLLEFKKNSTIINLASYIGMKKSSLFIILLTCVVSGFGFISIFNSSTFIYFKYEGNVFLIEILMSLILLMINQFDSFFLTDDRYRWVGDGIFLLPLLIIF